MRALTLFTALLSIAGFTAPLLADDPAAGKADTPSYLFRYKLKQGDELRYQVTHLGQTETRVQGKTDTMEVRTVSTKVWRVVEVNDAGEATFEHSVDHVEMTQKIGEGEELRWDSRSDKAPPVAFEPVADTLGKPLCRVRINGRGQVKHRDDFAGSRANLGMGELVLPLPEEPIAVGGQWIVPREVRVRDKDGSPKVVKIREVYKLDRVATGVATITIRSEPLTPLTEANEKAQALQQLSNGTLRFDLDAGRILSKQLDWDEQVVGFQGADSLLKYLARLTEEYGPATQSAAAPKSATLK